MRIQDWVYLWAPIALIVVYIHLKKTGVYYTEENKREQKRIDDNYSFVQAQHYQATRELSKSRHITNETYRKWNSSAYKYNPLKKRYEFDEKLGRASDIPKYIKER